MTKPNQKIKILATLFASMLRISTCTFGGGFVIVTLMRRRFVDQLGWLNEAEILDMTALAQTAPGAIAVNAAILLGWHMAGFGGMLSAVLGTVIPPVLILSVISAAYSAFSANAWVALALGGMQAGVAAVIADVVCTMARGVVQEGNRLHLAVMLVAFGLAYGLRINVVWIIALAAATGALSHRLCHGKGRTA